MGKRKKKGNMIREHNEVIMWDRYVQRGYIWVILVSFIYKGVIYRGEGVT